MSHAARERVNARHPLHITVRVAGDIVRLRARSAREAVRDALAVATAHIHAEAAFRICHASIQHDHIHLIAEADSNEAMTRGMKAFLVSCARRINRSLGRRGTVFPDRYHAVALGTPTQVRNALGYCLSNWRKHGEALAGVRLDPYSSAFALPDWDDEASIRFADIPLLLPVALPRTWLLTEGWRRAGPLSPWTRPGG